MSTRIRKKRPNEKSLPKQLQIPESFLYSKLQALERQVDTLLIRKRLDIQESLSKSLKQIGQLRIFIGNTFDSETGSWTMTIEGKLISGPPQAKSKFSTFVKSAVIELVTGETVEWIRNQQQPETDGIELKRAGRDQIDAKIHLSLDHQPEKFTLEPALSQLLGLRVETKSTVIMAVWQYIKANKLQDGSDFRVVHCDEKLQAVFGCQEFVFNQLTEYLSPHMLPVEPVTIEYTIRTDVERATCPFVVDIEVEIDDSIRNQMMKYILNTSGQKEYAQLDNQIQKMIQQIHVHKLKRDFMTAFYKNPVGFLEKWVSAQSRDLEVVLGESQFNAEWQRRGQFYHENWVPDAILHYLSTHQ